MLDAVTTVRSFAPMLGYQVVFRAEADRILAPDVASRRVFARVVARIGRPHGLFGFGLADTHGHCALACDLARVNRFVHDARLALSHHLRLPMVAPAVHPIRDTWHAESVLAYVHRQDEHHGVGTDPLREGTSLPDLCGLRPSGLWLADTVRALLPRVRRADLLAQWGLVALDEAEHLELLAEAGAAAIGAPALSGRADDTVAARRACVHATDAGPNALAEALGIAARTVRHLRGQAPDPRLVRAVRLQMGLRAAIGPPGEAAFVGEGGLPRGRR
ncbi:MAG: hypothetical protein V4850_02760 [Myxococcota bacterium]